MKIMNDSGEFSKEFFYFLKYNQIPKDKISLSKSDEAIYKAFIHKIKTLETSLQNEDNTSNGIFGSIISMFGFNRHYCSISGMPIIGKYYKIGRKIVSQEAYDAYKTVQELENITNSPKSKNKNKE